MASFALGAARQTVIDWQRGGGRRARILEAFPIDLLPADEEDREPIDEGKAGAVASRGCRSASAPCSS